MSLTGVWGPFSKAYLRAHCREGPQTCDWPEGTHRHFVLDRAYLWVNGDQWHAGSVAPDSLLELARHVYWFVGGEFEAWEEESVGPALVQLGHEPPPYPGPGWAAVVGDDLAARVATGYWLQSLADVAVVPPAFDELLDHFDERHRRTFADGLTAVWLERGAQRIYLITEDYRQEGARSSWWLQADNVEELERLARHVWRWGNLKWNLTAHQGHGPEVLRRLRRRKGLRRRAGHSSQWDEGAGAPEPL
jgi:hypothetical protein